MKASWQRDSSSWWGQVLQVEPHRDRWFLVSVSLADASALRRRERHRRPEAPSSTSASRWHGLLWPHQVTLSDSLPRGDREGSTLAKRNFCH